MSSASGLETRNKNKKIVPNELSIWTGNKKQKEKDSTK